MPRLLICSIFLFFSLYSYTQSAITEKKPFSYMLDIGLFKSEQEKQLFEAFTAGKEPDYLSLYLISDPTFQEKSLLDISDSRIENFLTKSDNRDRNYSSKELKKIYKEIHSDFFSKYIENPAFGQIFKNGNYNC